MSTWAHPALCATRSTATTPEREAELQAAGWVRVDVPRKLKGNRRARVDVDAVRSAAREAVSDDRDES